MAGALAFLASLVHAGSVQRVRAQGCRAPVGASAEPWLLPPSPAQMELGGDSQAGQQQDQPCLGFSIIKYITSQPASVSLEIHTEFQMLVLFAE